MIQAILFFVLGFLCAGFLVLTIAPAVWRRAVRMTRKRIVASVPLTANEIQADKDLMRAEFAMSIRRMEMAVESARRKSNAQAIEIGHGREELKRLVADGADKGRAISELEAGGSELRAELRLREDRLQSLSEKLAEAERAMVERGRDLQKLGKMYEEASYSASSRQIELVARETEVEKIAGDLAALQGQRKEADRRAEEIAAEGRGAIETLKAEKKRADELEAKLERMMAAVADSEERLDRREKELARLREKANGNAGADDDLNQQLAAAREVRARLERDLAAAPPRAPSHGSATDGADTRQMRTGLSADRDRLEDRLTLLMRENRKLKSDLAAREAAGGDDGSEERQERARLREQMNDMAAEVVNLTAMLDGPDSPIARALGSSTANPDSQTGSDGKITSLADRVRALRKAASAG